VRVEHALIIEIAVCIVAAWILAVIAQSLRQPVILAYLLAGLVVGPVGSGLVREEQSIAAISELGLILLLYMIGLEIDLKTMLGAGRVITVTGLVQVLGTAALGVGVFALCGFALKAGALDALYLGVAAALSSTVIVVKILYDKRELETLAGRITVGVLILQDLFAILFLAIQPNLSSPSFGLVVWSFLKVFLLMAIAFAASRYALPPLFRAVARVPELVLVGALAWCFLLAGLAGRFGLSSEMGALVAGVSMSAFPYTLDVTAKLTTLRDFFVTLFFVSLGMKIPAPTGFYVEWALIFAAFVVTSRLLTIFTPLHLMRQGHRVGLVTSTYLGQVSELSLVVLALGLEAEQVKQTTLGIVSYAFVLLAVTSSYAMAQIDTRVVRVIGWLKKIGLKDLDQQNGDSASPVEPPHLFVLGFSWTASSFLEEITRDEPALLNELAVIDFNPRVNQELRRRGVRVIYGDISQRDTLVHAGVDKAEIIISTLPNTVLKGTSNLRLVQQLREINPHAQIIVHAELFADVPKLYAAGASYVCVPRLVEAVDLFGLVRSARKDQLAEKRKQLDRELVDRREVIP
jgi:Kef-type K+ transport system membrane component KefB